MAIREIFHANTSAKGGDSLLAEPPITFPLFGESQQKHPICFSLDYSHTSYKQNSRRRVIANARLQQLVMVLLLGFPAAASVSTAVKRSSRSFRNGTNNRALHAALISRLLRDFRCVSTAFAPSAAN